MADDKYIDVESALRRVGGNEGLFKRLLGKFETSIDMDEFNKAVSEQNNNLLGEIVHAAKGIAGNLSLTCFFNASSTLMDQLRDGGSPQQADIEEFRTSYDETLVAVKEYLG